MRLTLWGMLGVVMGLGMAGAWGQDAPRPQDTSVGAAPVVWEAGSKGLRLQVRQDGGYSVVRAGEEWLTGGATALHCRGRWYSTRPVNGQEGLRLVTTQLTSGRDALGTWTADGITWDAGGTPFVTTFRVYDRSDRVVFAQKLPEGAEETALPGGEAGGPLSAFPCFETGGRVGSLHSLTYAGTFAAAQVGVGLGARAGGTDGGVPLVLFDGGLRTVVLSPLNRFKAVEQAKSGDVGGALACGVTGEIESIPAGFVVETILDAGQGINDSLYAWGSDLLAYSGKTRGAGRDDTIMHLGYWTDNGSYYYYATEAGKDYEATLLDVRADAARRGLPYRYFQMDSWWYFKGMDGGTDRWEARPEVLPDGVGGFHDKLGLPLVLHNRWWSAKTHYAEEYSFVRDAGSAVPITRPFWDDLMAKAAGDGCAVYEQDWLARQYHDAAGLREEAGAAGDWLGSMGRAAAASGLSVQYCMPLPSDLLFSTQLPGVTQARVSDDYHPGNGQWNIGATSLLAWALGLAPFKDTFWTVSDEPGSPYGTGAREPNAELETLVAAWSAGPVGPGDKIGLANGALLRETCRADGTLLRPDKPATPIDRWFLGGVPGEVWATRTDVGALRWHYVLAAGLKGAFSLGVGDLSPGTYVAFDPETQMLTPFDGAHPLALSSAGRGAKAVPFSFYVIAPRSATGWAFLGEARKFIAVARQRFSSISGDGLRLTLAGQAGEPVILQWSAPSRPVRVSVGDANAAALPAGQTPDPGTPNGWSYDGVRHLLTVFVTVPAGGNAPVQVVP